ncbi:hypothetical protein O0I10_005073 [Lichtheimia ornata]|uniref:F-box domain-containing protein n=1 Tax=Lichtheimia ornata TaxID=688661 RepID=A0AAD7V4S1_9FUNG|nr:uncharacterized protein O0I10_005073 [Lichtheimia ornata]KAJ8659358.1 hypothetical protein O0I10_005073 [Lichtheimia ornata]
MTNKSIPVRHGITSASTEEMHHVSCSRNYRGAPFKVKSSVDMLLNEADFEGKEGGGAQVTVLEYEPSFVHYLAHVSNNNKNNHSESAFFTMLQEEEQYQPHEGALSMKQHVRSKVDIIMHLPKDLLYSILWYLDPADLVEMTAVSQGWCRRLDHYAEGCGQIDLSDNDDNVGGTYEKLVSMSPHVHGVSVMFLETNEPIDMLLQEISSLPFTALRSLDLGCMVTSSQTIFSILKQVKDTLLHLSLLCVSHDQALCLGTILSICSNLKCLQYCLSELQGVDQDLFFDNNSSSSDTSHPLETLQLVAQTIHGHELEPILRYCPNIRRLVVCECGPDAIDAIRHYTPPRLEYLHINPNLENIFPPWTDIEYSIPISAKDHLHTVIANKLNPAMMDRLSLLLADHAVSTLGHLHLDINAPPSSSSSIITSNPWKSTASFDSLRILTWSGLDTTWNNALTRVLQGCNQLEEVNMKQCDALDDTVVDAMLDLTRLQKLSLEDMKDTKRIPGLLTRFLEHHGSLRQDSPLEELRLVAEHSILTPVTLDALAKVMTLRSISLLIRDKDTSISEHDMEMFIQHLGSTTLALQKLELAYLEDCVTDAAVQRLGDIDGLIQVAFIDLKRITNASVKVLLEACSSLQLFKIEGSPLVSYDMLAQIESKMMERAIRL